LCLGDMTKEKAKNDKGERIYGEHYECKWWEEACKLLPPLRLIALCIFTDSSQLLNFGSQEAYNMQISLCNLPAKYRNTDDGTITLAFLPKLKDSIYSLINHSVTLDTRDLWEYLIS
jgi:hypothetical protein